MISLSFRKKWMGHLYKCVARPTGRQNIEQSRFCPSRGCKNGSVCRLSQSGNWHRGCGSGHLFASYDRKTLGTWRDIILVLEKKSRLRICCQDKSFTPEVLLFFPFLFPPDSLRSSIRAGLLCCKLASPGWQYLFSRHFF